MPPTTRKRKASSSTQQQPGPKKQSKDEPRISKQSNTVGRTKSDKPVRDAESTSTSEYTSFTIQGDKGKAIPCQARNWNSSNSAELEAAANEATTLIFTHGASGGLDNPATKLFAEGYASANHASIISFQGTMNLPSRVKSFESILSHLESQHSAQPTRQFAVGGRSMGARAAVMVAATHENVKKIVAVSYPLTSPNGQTRDEILLSLPADKSVLFISGAQDSMCNLEDLGAVIKKMQARAKLVVVEGADHGMSLSLTGLGLKKGLKEDVICRVRRESGRCARAWVRDEGSLGDEWRIGYDVVGDRVVTGRKRDGDAGFGEIAGPEGLGAGEVDGGEGDEGVAEEESEKQQGHKSEQKGRRGGTKNLEKKDDHQEDAGKKKRAGAAGNIKEPESKKRKKGR